MQQITLVYQGERYEMTVRKVMKTLPDFERAKQYALERLEQDLPDNLYYHSLAHTVDDVVPAAERLAAIAGIEGEDLLLLLTAALYHDTGFVEQYDNHESVSIRIASEILPEFGYSKKQLQIISGMILATKLPQTPHNFLEQIMADADLDNLGRVYFESRSQMLRAELEVLGTPLSDEAWYERQLQFLQSHRYFTDAARSLRDKKKQQNLEALVARHR